MTQMLNGKIGETCNLQPAQAAQDVSLEVRTKVSQVHESPVHMRFRPPFGKIVTPILLDESLSGLWSQSAHDLLELCTHCPLPLTFNKNIILNRHTCQKTIAPEKEDRLMISHVILVHWHSTDMVLSGVKPWLCSLESKKQLFSPIAATWIRRTPRPILGKVALSFSHLLTVEIPPSCSHRLAGRVVLPCAIGPSWNFSHSWENIVPRAISHSA
jgi:hypothetical protein